MVLGIRMNGRDVPGLSKQMLLSKEESHGEYSSYKWVAISQSLSCGWSKNDSIWHARKQEVEKYCLARTSGYKGATLDQLTDHKWSLANKNREQDRPGRQAKGIPHFFKKQRIDYGKIHDTYIKILYISTHRTFCACTHTYHKTFKIKKYMFAHSMIEGEKSRREFLFSILVSSWVLMIFHSFCH